MNRFIAAAIGGLTVDTAPLANLSGTPVLLFSGSRDWTVWTVVMEAGEIEM